MDAGSFALTGEKPWSIRCAGVSCVGVGGEAAYSPASAAAALESASPIPASADQESGMVTVRPAVVWAPKLRTRPPGANVIPLPPPWQGGEVLRDLLGGE